MKEEDSFATAVTSAEPLLLKTRFFMFFDTRSTWVMWFSQQSSSVDSSTCCPLFRRTGDHAIA